VARPSSKLREIALLVLLSVLVFAVSGEIAVRFYLSRNMSYDVEMSRYSQLLKADADNPKIGHVHRPNGEAVLMGVPVRTNSAGFRDDEMPIERGAKRRLVFLGDSLTFAWGVAEEASFEKRLEQSLDARQPTEILNLAAGNYNTTQEVELYLERGRAYRPDGVVLFYFINDAEPVPVKSHYEWLGASKLVTFYWSRMKALRERFSPGPGYRSYYAALYDDAQPGWQATREAFGKLARATAEDGTDLRVVILPELHDLVDYPFGREHAMVTEELTRLGVPVLDLAPRFAAIRDPQRLWVARDDAHPNAPAHGLIADYALPFLLEAPEP
jgi:lysophospholipase L1-like esterase